MFEILYPFGVALTKISICLNYLRIFPLQTFNECFCKVAMVFTACWCISTIIPQIAGTNQRQVCAELLETSVNVSW